MKTVTESIFTGDTVIIPMADVQHIEKYWYRDDKKERDNHRGINVITKHTKWSSEMDTWENAIYLPKVEADNFITAWCMYRSELEKETLVDFTS